jgi:LPS-assembly protein
MVEASGSVRIGDDRGNVLVADSVALSDDLRDGAIENLLLVLEDGGRMAARSGQRQDNRSTLESAVYSPCSVIDDDTGCPQTPLWAVKAVRVRHDPGERRVYYTNARLEFLGVSVLALPRFSHPESSLRNLSGLLTPGLRVIQDLGLEISIPYYWSISPSQDLTATANIYTQEFPMVALQYRNLTELGPVRFTLRGTWSEGVAFGPDFEIVKTGQTGFRGMIEGNGRLTVGEDLSSTFALRLTSDPNFPGRYQITYDTRFRSLYALEKQQLNLYAGARAWYFQYLNPGVPTERIAQAVPLGDVSWTPDADPLGGRVTMSGNMLHIFRADGQDYQRFLGWSTWERSMLTKLGQRITFTGLLRSDLYLVQDAARADIPIYAGRDGTQGRFIPAASVNIEWPFAGKLGKGVQTIVPRLMFVGSARDVNADIPNEDSRAIELDDINLFAMNRFPGYDRWEGGARMVYGLSWNWSRRRIALSGDIGQSFRFEEPDPFIPDGTGLDSRLSDIVGRFSIQAGRLASMTQRLRLDKDTLEVRRSDLDVTVGSGRTFASAGYLRYNRDVVIEDLPDQEEVRFGAQVALFRYWAVFGAMTIDLTSTGEDPLATGDGFQPIRSQAGFIYDDECFEVSFTWQRNYIDNLNAPRGNTFSFSINLKNLGTPGRD